MATLGALDTIDGGAGANTLTISDSASIPSVPATVTNIQTFNATSTAGSVGTVAVDATIPARQTVTYDFGATGKTVGTGTVKVTIGGISKTVGTAGSATSIADITGAIEAIMDEAYATSTSTAGEWATDNSSGGGKVITVKANKLGVALPTVTIAGGTDNTTLKTGTVTETQANQVEAAAIAATTVTVPTGVTTATISAATTANVTSKSTAATTVTGTAVTVSSGTTQTVTASDSVKATGATGAVIVDISAAPATSIAASSSGGWAAGAGAYVTGGTSVKITEAVGVASSGSISASNATAVQVGNNPESSTATKLTGASSGARASSTADGYPEVIGNKSTAPTGDVTVSTKSAYTNKDGYSSVKYGTGDVKVYMNGGTTASVTGASTVTIQDINTTLLKSSLAATAAPGTSKLTTVNLQGISGNVGISTDAITTLSVVDSSASTTPVITINSNTNANTGALALSVGNSTVNVKAGNASSVAVTGVAAAYASTASTGKNASKDASDLDLDAAKATSVSFGGSSKITLNSGSDLAKMTTITANGSSDLVLGTVTSFGKLTSVDASAATGNVSATIDDTIAGQTATDYGFSVKTGSGKDTVTIAGKMTSGTDANGAVIQNTISLGAGDDKLLFLASSNGEIASGATADGGDGSDLVAASLLNAGNSTRVTNFEILGLDSTSTYDASLLVGATGLQALAVGGTYTGVKTTQGLTYVDSLSSGNITLQFPSAATTATTDSYTVTFAGVALSTATATSKTAIAGQTLIIDKIENVNIVSGGTGLVANSLSLDADAARIITVTGDQELNLTLVATVGDITANSSTNGMGVSLIDASALTGKITISNANIAVPFGDVTTIKGGSGNDAITAAKTKTVVDGGAGNDTITVSTTVATTLTGGAGKDTFVVTSATANSTSAPIITTITDYDRVSDTIQMGTTDSLKKFVPTSGNSLVEVITASLHATGGSAVNAAVWFTYGGDTYIAHQDGSTGFQTTDIIVKLTGIVDLTTAADNAANTTGLVGTA